MREGTYQFGEFSLDVSRFQLRRNDQELRLEKKPMELLLLLAGCHGGFAPVLPPGQDVLVSQDGAATKLAPPDPRYQALQRWLAGNQADWRPVMCRSRHAASSWKQGICAYSLQTARCLLRPLRASAKRASSRRTARSCNPTNQKNMDPLAGLAPSLRQERNNHRKFLGVTDPIYPR